MPTYTRIAGHRGNPVRLDVTFNRGGVPTGPYAITKVEIYHTQVLPHNKVAEFVTDSPCAPHTTYPSPIYQLTQDIPAGNCGTDAITGDPVPGMYTLLWDVPDDAVAPGVYFDVWYYLATNPCLLDDYIGSTVCDGDCPDLTSGEFDSLLLKSCNRFWVYPDSWDATDGLQTVRFGFEPLDQKFHKPEARPLEVGIVPLPLYDYNYNLVTPLMPMLQASITIQTGHRELLVDAAPMEIGIRQGSYRSNPYVLRYPLDTSAFLIGTYYYRILVTLPDGTTRSSKEFVFTVS